MIKKYVELEGKGFIFAVEQESFIPNANVDDLNLRLNQVIATLTTTDEEERVVLLVNGEEDDLYLEFVAFHWSEQLNSYVDTGSFSDCVYEMESDEKSLIDELYSYYNHFFQKIVE